MNYQWENTNIIGGKKYTCGYCNSTAAPSSYYRTVSGTQPVGKIYICPNCARPTFFDSNNNQYPSIRLGNTVNGISDKNVQTAYLEARDCTSTGAYTGAVLLCRKLLMNIAVQKRAEKGLKFVKYVDYLNEKGFIPPDGKSWVEVIRKKGNEATHEIAVKTKKDAKLILHFVEMLLKFIYEFPSLLKSDNSPEENSKTVTTKKFPEIPNVPRRKL